MIILLNITGLIIRAIDQGIDQVTQRDQQWCMAGMANSQSANFGGMFFQLFFQIVIHFQHILDQLSGGFGPHINIARAGGAKP